MGLYIKNEIIEITIKI